MPFKAVYWENKNEKKNYLVSVVSLSFIVSVQNTVKTYE